MSTFDGIIEEFPEIRIDYFRSHAGRTPPAAVFLSHVHSDHLLGLETLRMPFVYCSAATRRILLRLEKYPHRINFAKGVLEARKQTYKHLKLILRALPLDTPVELNISPKCNLRVTLLDANHCPGAVMFLIESEQHAVLYTGDIRAEPWWVNSIARRPSMIPYTTGQKQLDCVYLDTTFASSDEICKRFPTKAEGISELLSKVSKCPSDSVFYFRAWTLGYEDVWIALSWALRSQVHVDEYQQRLFRLSPQDGGDTYPAPALTGHQVGNQQHDGCLTSSRDVRIHSCEPGMACYAALCKLQNVVWITPIVSRLQDGTEVAEVGAGGGRGDLYQLPELDLCESAAQTTLQVLCDEFVKTEAAADHLKNALSLAMAQRNFRIALEGLGIAPDEEITIQRFVDAIAGRGQSPSLAVRNENERLILEQKIIHFPYSRHSSYQELRELIRVLRPKDICPCTVDLDLWRQEVSMSSLFGDLCSSSVFKYDQIIREQSLLRQQTMATQATKGSADSQIRQHYTQEMEHQEKSDGPETDHDTMLSQTSDKQVAATPTLTNKVSSREPLEGLATDKCIAQNMDASHHYVQATFKTAWRSTNPDLQDIFIATAEETSDEDHNLHCSQVSVASSVPDVIENSVDISRARIEAYRAAVACLEHGDSDAWDDLHIRSAGWVGHSEKEMELG